MTGFKKLIPHLFTAGNLVGGVLAIIFALTGKLEYAPYCIFISAFLDFFDGFAARLLKVPSEMGKQLDSLADMVTFGVAPGVIVFVMLKISFLEPFCPNYPPIQSGEVLTIYTGDLYENCYGQPEPDNLYLSKKVPDSLNTSNPDSGFTFTSNFRHYCGPMLNEPPLQKFYIFFPLIALIIPIMSMFRLAKFNLDTRQSDSFIGLPTPANTIFFASLPLIIFQYSAPEFEWQKTLVDLLLNPWFLLISTLIMSILLVAELPLFALKFKSFGWKGNEIRYIFLTLCAVMLATLWWLALPLIIILYILLSLIQNLRKQ